MNDNFTLYAKALGFIVIAGLLYIAGGYMADKAISTFKATIPTP